MVSISSIITLFALCCC